MSTPDCTGNCKRGRACDCMPDIEDADLGPLTDGERAVLLLIWAAAFAVLISLGGFIYQRVFA